MIMVENSVDDMFAAFPHVPKNLIKIERYTAIPGLKDLIGPFLRSTKARYQKKHCFDNAVLTMLASEEIRYVEGIVELGAGLEFPLEHAWNAWGTHYFDLTSDLLFHGELARDGRYFSIDETFDEEEAREMATHAIRSFGRHARKRK